MIKKEKASEKSNRNYFKSLIATRASIEMLNIAWAGIFVGAIETVIAWMTSIDLGQNPPYNFATFSVLVGLIVMTCSQIVIIMEPLRKFFYRHQKFSSVWQLVFSITLLYQMVFLAYVMVMTEKSRLNLKSSLTIPYIVFAGCFYLICLFYNIFWLRSQLKKGMSEERTKKNSLAKKVVWGASSIAIIFFGSMNAKYLSEVQARVFGIAATLLFIGAFSRLHIEYAYASILKWQDESYWEKYIKPEPLTAEQKKKRIRILVTVLEVVLFFSVGIFEKELSKIKTNKIFSMGMLILFTIIFIDWGILIIRKIYRHFVK